MTLTRASDDGDAETEEQGAKRSEQNARLADAVQFLTPWLADFKFTSSHAILYLLAKLPEQAGDKEKIKDIVRLEHKAQKNRAQKNISVAKEQQKEAIRVFVDWLLNLDADSVPLSTFLDALTDDTPEHLHVHNMLCLCSLYLPSHQPLVAILAQKLQDEKLQVEKLLWYLQLLGLVECKQAPSILEMAKQYSSATSETCTQLAHYLLACVFSNQARVLLEKFQRPNPPARWETQPRDSSGSGATSESIAQADENPDEDSLTDSDWERLSPVAMFLEVLVDGRKSSRLCSGERSSRGTHSAAQADKGHCGTGNLSHAEKKRLDGVLMSWRQTGGELWPRVLQKVLEGATGQKEVWTCGLNEHQIRDLWNKATDLIRDGAARHGNGVLEDDGAGAGSIANSHETHPKTVDPGNLGVIEDWVKDSLEHVKLMPNLIVGENVDDDDDQSLVSTENNAAQRQSSEAATSGVLREEEANELKAGPIQLRLYQDELLESARAGENVLIWLPTGTGKTYIVLKYAEEHLKGGEDRKVGFVVPKVRLARQQYERFQAYLPKFKPYLKCGETSGTAASKHPLGEVLKTNSVVVMTAQCLVEAVESKKVRLDQFSLLVLDECHHTRGGHPLRTLMNQYMELKYEMSYTAIRLHKLPQIIGLTASPGVGKARGKDRNDAVTYLKHLCARLNVTHICSVRKNVEDLQKYVYQPRTILKECGKRKVDKLDERIQELMKFIENRMPLDPDVEKYARKTDMRSKLEAPSANRGQDQYTQWLSDAETTIKEVAHPKAYRALKAHIDLLRLCQECLILNKDCDSLGALEILREKVDAMDEEKPNKEQVDEDLMDLYQRHTRDFHNGISLDAECSDKDCENPNLKYLEEVILERSQDDKEELQTQAAAGEMMTAENGLPPSPAAEEETEPDHLHVDDNKSITSEEGRHLDNDVLAMVFVRSLDLSLALLRWMQRHPKLRRLNPGRITGINASVKDGGMTKSDVTAVMAKFNAGGHRLVICTSAAEEGLDFKACNLVIPYLYEASMVSMIQTRGRARQERSVYCVMGEQTADSTNKGKDNIESEKVMELAVRDIQKAVDANPEEHKNEINKIQKDFWNSRWRKDVQERKRLRQQLPVGQYRVKCRGCSIPACTSENIRVLRTTNRVVIGEEFRNKYVRKSQDVLEARTYDSSIPRTGKIQCKGCGHYWGIMVWDVRDSVEYPVIPIKSFIVEKSDGTVDRFEKWSHAFAVPEITDEDRKRHSDPLLSGGDEREVPEVKDPNDLGREEAEGGETEEEQSSVPGDSPPTVGEAAQQSTNELLPVTVNTAVR